MRDNSLGNINYGSQVVRESAVNEAISDAPEQIAADRRKNASTEPEEEDQRDDFLGAISYGSQVVQESEVNEALGATSRIRNAAGTDDDSGVGGTTTVETPAQIIAGTDASPDPNGDTDEGLTVPNQQRESAPLTDTVADLQGDVGGVESGKTTRSVATTVPTCSWAATAKISFSEGPETTNCTAAQAMTW